MFRLQISHNKISEIKLKLAPNTDAHLGTNFCFPLMLIKENIAPITTEMFKIYFVV